MNQIKQIRYWAYVLAQFLLAIVICYQWFQIYKVDGLIFGILCVIALQLIIKNANDLKK